MIQTEENRNTCRKTYRSANLSTKNLTSIDLESKRDLRGERPATNCPTYDKGSFGLATVKSHVVRHAISFVS